MVLGLLVIAGIPTTIGVCEALSAQKKQNAAQKEKARFHMTADLSLDGRPPVECWVVLADGRVSFLSPIGPSRPPATPAHIQPLRRREREREKERAMRNDVMMPFLFFPDSGSTKRAAYTPQTGAPQGERWKLT